MSNDPSDSDRLTAGWWEYVRLATGSRAERKALSLGEPADVRSAWTDVQDRLDAGRVESLQLVLALIETTPEPAGVGVVGAGPLEDLVHRHGDSLVDELDRLARQDPAFRQAMAAVWLSPGVLSPETERRLRQWMGNLV